MNLDFRELSRENRIKAITEVLRQDDISRLAYLVGEQYYDVYGWFNFLESVDGLDYWYSLVETDKE
jgi:hypothetical protein